MLSTVVGAQYYTEYLPKLRPIIRVQETTFTRLLNPRGELEDNTVASFLRLVERRSLISGLPKVWAYDSFFFHPWTQSRMNRVKHWTKNANILKKRYLVFHHHRQSESLGFSRIRASLFQDNDTGSLGKIQMRRVGEYLSVLKRIYNSHRN